MQITIETITPEIAKEYLKQNTGNFRNPDSKRVDRYAKDIWRGAWDFTGDTIKFNGKILLDGQHRLLGCVKAGKPFTTAVARGVQESFNIDRGRPRSIGQWLKHEGVKNANNIAAVARQVLIYEQSGTLMADGISSNKFTDKDIVEFVLANELRLQAVHSLACKQKICIGSCLASVLYSGAGEALATENDTCVWFADALATGAELGEDEPVNRLRNVFIRQRGTSKIPASVQKQMIAKAWNYTVEGRECKQLLVRMTGPSKTRPVTEILVAQG